MGEANFLLRDFTLHLWKRTREAFGVMIVWVRGHHTDVGNELADRCAGEGADADDEAACLGRWRPADWGFHDFRRDFPQHFVSGCNAGKDLFAGERRGDEERPRKIQRTVGRAP